MSELDNFFKKKDVKKSKQQQHGKVANAPHGVKSTMSQKAQKSIDVISAGTISPKISTTTTSVASKVDTLVNAAQNFSVQDEWKEFEEGKKDYSGLKIQHLCTDDYDDDDDDIDESSKNQTSGPGSDVMEQVVLIDGRTVMRKKEEEQYQGPWKIPTQQTALTLPADHDIGSEDSNNNKEEQSVNNLEPKKTTSYVPPQKRFENNPVSLSRGHNAIKPSKVDVSSKEMFPTLT